MPARKMLQHSATGNVMVSALFGPIWWNQGQQRAIAGVVAEAHGRAEGRSREAPPNPRFAKPQWMLKR